MDKKTVGEYVKDHYGLKCSKIKPLVGSVDKNYLLTESGTETRYIFKLANPSENKKEDIEAQNELLKHVKSSTKEVKFVFPEVFPSKNSKMCESVQTSCGRVWGARLLSYVPGKLLADVKEQKETLIASVGEMLAAFDEEISTFLHPALLKRVLQWDLKQTLELQSYLQDVDDSSAVRNNCSFMLQRFENFVVQKIHKIRSQVIHGDANLHNILVNEEEEKVQGLIDFGDVTYSCLVFDVGVAASYITHFKEDPLRDVVTFLRAYHQTYPLLEDEVDVLYECIGARLCMSILINSRQLKTDPKNDYLKVSMQPAIDALFKLVHQGPFIAKNIFRAACGMEKIVRKFCRTKKSLLESRKVHLGKNLSLSYQSPLKIVRGFMQYIYEEDGRPFLDTLNNICHVGHCHPRVVKVGCSQMRELNTNTRYLHDEIILFSEQLLSTFPETLCVVYFVCSGSEANELALRMAKTHTMSNEIIILNHAYHGNTNELIGVSPYKFNGKGGGGKPKNVHVIPLPDGFRGKYKYDDPQMGSKYAKEVDPILEKLRVDGKKPAVFLHESFPGVAGQVELPETGFLDEVYKKVRKRGGVTIADEVQVGFGRVGSHMWAFERCSVCPDIVTLGKPMGNGHPLSAVVCTKEISESFNNGMEYFNSFGGNPVSCRIGREVLSVIREEKLQENALEVGEYMKRGLKSLQAKHKMIGDVRGQGLYLGVDLVKDRSSKAPAFEEAVTIAEKMKEKGILISVDGYLHNVLKIKPPMCFNKENAESYINTLDQVLSTIS